MRHDRSKNLYERAIHRIPGGVSSPVRAFRSVGGEPVFVARADGPYVYDADGNRYIDYVCSWGPLILGHAHAAVIEAIERTAKDGTSFGFATRLEVELAERVADAVPSIDMVRFVNSGTEATMSALRLARGFTGRDRLIKFAGCYHGHADAFLSESAGSGVATLGIPGCSGVPKGAAGDTLTLPFNDIGALEEAMAKHGDSVAAICLEPVACNMGLVQPVDGFLETLRRLCDTHGSLLIFDEVITGFRLGLGGAQEHFKIRPDLTTFGKIIGGGLPVGAYGGRREVMEKIAPLGPVYQAGTLSGNPLTMAAGNATLEVLAEPGLYEQLAATGRSLAEGVAKVLERRTGVGRVDSLASIFYLWFKPGATEPPRGYDDIKQGDAELFTRFFRSLLDQGIAVAPSAFEVGFVSAAHEQRHVDATITAVDEALKQALA